MSVRFSDRRADECCWPLWDRGERTGFVCGALAEPGRSYCPAHQTRARGNTLPVLQSRRDVPKPSRIALIAAIAERCACRGKAERNPVMAPPLRPPRRIAFPKVAGPALSSTALALGFEIIVRPRAVAATPLAPHGQPDRAGDAR